MPMDDRAEVPRTKMRPAAVWSSAKRASSKVRAAPTVTAGGTDEDPQPAAASTTSSSPRLRLTDPAVACVAALCSIAVPAGAEPPIATPIGVGARFHPDPPTRERRTIARRIAGAFREA
jgi:hypothetical protein